MTTARVIGSGPNGLAAAITLARAAIQTTVFERNHQLGGGCSTAETTLPGFLHDLGSSVYPMGKASPFFRSLPFEIPWIEPGAPCAHPLDDGTAVILEHSIAATAENLDAADRASYRSLVQPTAENFDKLIDDFLAPMLHIPKHPLLLARFGLAGLQPATTLAKSRFKGPRARALFAGMAAHSVQPLESPMTAAVGLVFLAAAHSVGWPILRGGARTLTTIMADYLRQLGGAIESDQEVTQLWSGGGPSLTLADVTPRQLLRIGDDLPPRYRRRLESFHYGAGIFKIDYALSEPIPWTAKECLRAATVHIGGTLEEFAASERRCDTSKPFVLLVQPSLFDPARAPAGKHTAWAYCHVPNGSRRDWLPIIEAQITRFAPAFADCVLARSVMSPARLEQWNPNMIGGDVSAGAMTPSQLLFRPTFAQYRTPVKGLYLCGASTPPGGGVHGMAGFHAATMALRDL